MINKVKVGDKIATSYITAYVYDMLTLRQAEDKYSDLLGYSFYDCSEGENMRSYSRRMVCIYTDEADNFMGWDFISDVKIKGTILEENNG